MLGELLEINPRHSWLSRHDIPPARHPIVLPDVPILHGERRARCAGGRHFLEPPERCTPGSTQRRLAARWAAAILVGEPVSLYKQTDWITCGPEQPELHVPCTRGDQATARGALPHDGQRHDLSVLQQARPLQAAHPAPQPRCSLGGFLGGPRVANRVPDNLPRRSASFAIRCSR